jgi:hypothetical protein
MWWLRSILRILRTCYRPAFSCFCGWNVF